MEVIPKDWIYLGITVGVLHVCGGDPAKSYYLQIFKECSPRMWRWSLKQPLHLPLCLVFSTYVEVILYLKCGDRIYLGVLHVCGGDPTAFKSRLSIWWCSPRMWRWSCSNPLVSFAVEVFSTYVEVFLKNAKEARSTTGVLHVCGGDPLAWARIILRVPCSPRMWRWSRRVELGET